MHDSPFSPFNTHTHSNAHTTPTHSNSQQAGECIRGKGGKRSVHGVPAGWIDQEVWLATSIALKLWGRAYFSLQKNLPTECQLCGSTKRQGRP